MQRFCRKIATACEKLSRLEGVYGRIARPCHSLSCAGAKQWPNTTPRLRELRITMRRCECRIGTLVSKLVRRIEAIVHQKSQSFAHGLVNTRDQLWPLFFVPHRRPTIEPSSRFPAPTSSFFFSCSQHSSPHICHTLLSHTSIHDCNDSRDGHNPRLVRSHPQAQKVEETCEGDGPDGCRGSSCCASS